MSAMGENSKCYNMFINDKIPTEIMIPWLINIDTRIINEARMANIITCELASKLRRVATGSIIKVLTNSIF